MTCNTQPEHAKLSIKTRGSLYDVKGIYVPKKHAKRLLMGVSLCEIWFDGMCGNLKTILQLNKHPGPTQTKHAKPSTCLVFFIIRLSRSGRICGVYLDFS